MFSRLEFIITETFIGLRRHPMMAFAAITSVAATLFVTGIVCLALLNATFAVRTALDRVRFAVFFYPETPRSEARDICERIAGLPQVQSAEFINKEDAWSRLAKDDPEYVRELGKNYLPDSIHIKATDVRDIPFLKEEISHWSGVKRVTDAPGVSEVLQQIRQATGKVGGVVGAILLLLSLVIIHHTIELTLYARRKEIHIMSLVGATPATVAMPFLLEGAVYGLIGGGVAFGVLGILYQYFVAMMRTEYRAALWQSPDMLTHGLLALAVGGVVLGTIGSTMSIVKYMRSPRSKITNA